MENALTFREKMHRVRQLEKEEDWSEKKMQMRHYLDYQDSICHKLLRAFEEVSCKCDDAANERQRLRDTVAKLSQEKEKDETRMMQQLNEATIMLQKKDNIIRMLTSIAEESIDMATQELRSVRETMDRQTSAGEALLKKLHLKLNILEKQLEEKEEENSKLSRMYDDLLSKIQRN
ncbi:uncharacterized protein LOC135400314 isoform X2 [Ornithodoros turicata]